MQPSNRPPGAAVGMAAPELEPTEWVNSQPFRLADLRERVMLVEFWTFDCVNCQRVAPALAQWHQAYAARGLVIVGVHTPEFPHERELRHVRAAMRQFGIE